MHFSKLCAIELRCSFEHLAKFSRKRCLPENHRVIYQFLGAITIEFIFCYGLKITYESFEKIHVEF